jgi:hypothetical protein
VLVRRHAYWLPSTAPEVQPVAARVLPR